MSSQCGELWATNVWHLLASLGHPSNLANSTGFASWLRYCSDIAHRRPTKLCTMFGRLLGWYTMYTFLRALALTEFCPVQSSLYFQVLRFRILALLVHGTPAGSVSQTLQRGTNTRNGITELSQRAPPIFERAAIALGIGPHSSIIYYPCSCACANVACACATAYKLVTGNRSYLLLTQFTKNI